MLAELDPLYIRMRPGAAMRRLMTHACFQGRQPSMRWLWLNHFYDRFIRAVMRVHPAPRQVEKPIFILGVGRSGTTILGKLLSFHPSVGFLNEAKALWHVIHPEEDVLGTYQACQRRYRLGASDANPDVCERAHRLYSAYLRFVRAERVVDKYPEALYRVPFLLAIFGDAKLVILLRNGLDTARSIASYSRANARIRQGKREDWWGVEDQKWRLLVEQVAAQHPLLSARVSDALQLRSPEDRAVIEWALAVHESQKWLEALSQETVILVRYEDMVARPAPILQALMEFCELSRDIDLIRYAERAIREPRQRTEALPLTPWVRDVFEQAHAVFDVLCAAQSR